MPAEAKKKEIAAAVIALQPFRHCPNPARKNDVWGALVSFLAGSFKKWYLLIDGRHQEGREQKARATRHRLAAARIEGLHRPESAERLKVRETANIRLLWVSITNLAVFGLVLAGIEQQHDLRRLLAVPGRAPGLWQTLAGDRWNLVTIAVLLTGILFEALRIRLAWLPNVGFYLCSFVAGIGGVVIAGNDFPREQVETAVVFYLLPMGIILVVNSYLYWPRRVAQH